MNNKIRKVIISIVWLAQFILRTTVLRLLVHDRLFRTRVQAESVHITAKRIARTLGLEIEIVNPEALQLFRNGNHLVISNHTSYVDILVLASLYPMNFITSVEMKNHPVLGMLTRFGGSLFTERRSISGLLEEVRTISGYLREGLSLGLFPEGTSFDGTQVMPFRNSLFQSAIDAEIPILPICVKYVNINRNPIDNEGRRKIAWINKEPFRSHLRRLLGFHSIGVKVEILPEIATDGKDRKVLSTETREAIQRIYHSL